jgi:hypothetical protein
LSSACTRIEDMFEIDGEATPAQILDSAARLVRARIELENAMLMHAVAWADRNGPETIHPDQLAISGGNHPVQLGGDGTPEVADLAPAELGAALNMSAGAASALLADSLDLRHRLPRLWVKICDGTLPGWQGRKVAKATRNLTKARAAEVDRRLADYTGSTPWPRLETLLTAAIADVDADNAEAEARLAQARRGVWTGQSNAHGVKTVYARMDAPAAIRLMGQVNRIGDMLTSRGVIGNADSRRATALGVLGDPVQAAWLLAQDRQPELFDPIPAADPAQMTYQEQPPRQRDTNGSDRHRSGIQHQRPGYAGSRDQHGERGNRAMGQGASATGDDELGLVAESDIHPSQRDLPGDQPTDDSAADNLPDVSRENHVLVRGQSTTRNDANDIPPDRGSGSQTDQTLEAFQAAIERIVAGLDVNQLRPTTQLIVHAAAETLHHGHGSLRCQTSTPSRRSRQRRLGSGPGTGSADETGKSTDQCRNLQDRARAVTEDLGPMTMPTVQTWLLHHRITLRPVIDLNKPPPPVDSYEIPQVHRQHVALRYPASLFPWSTSKQGLDLDHVIPYLAPECGGTPGQTSIANLAPVSRREHRLFTHGGWRRRQPEPGTLLVRAPHGHIYLTNNTGTHNLGTSKFAKTIWNAAATSLEAH